MIRHNTNIQTKEVKQYRLAGFKGVDFSSSPLNVTESRSPDAKNWIFDHGSPTKRNGWKQVAYVNGYAVNGMYLYATNTLLVYAGTKFFKVELTTTGVGYVTTEISTTGMTLSSNRVQFFAQTSERIFIVGAGDYLVWHKIGTPKVWTLEKVYDNAITYIPTTSISIDYEGFSGDSIQATLERPSLMTMWRKNTCQGVVGSAASTPATTTYQLDGNASTVYVAAEDILAYVDIEYKDSSNVEHELNLKGYYKLLGGLQPTVELRESYASSTVYGHIYKDGTMELNNQITEPITNGDNITVQFKGYNNYTVTQDHESMIKTAKFGVLFGVDGVTSQLFVSGGYLQAAYGNRDYYSYPLDYTYWPDNNMRIVGNSPITGYHRIGDGTLVIFKQKAYGEAAIFTRTGTLVTDTTEDYFTAEIVYSEKAGFADNYLTSRLTIDTLAGDSLYLANGGVKGIELSENVATDERFARGRSYFIDKKLEEYTLTNAVAITYKDRYYLAIDDDCFVADSRLKAKGELGDTFNYEWNFWDNIPAYTFAEINDSLYFGTSDGRICVFDTEYTDRQFEVISSGDMSFHPSTNQVLYNASIEVENDLGVKFDKNTLYQLVFGSTDIQSVTGSTVLLRSSSSRHDNIFLLNDGDKHLFVGHTDGSHVEVYIGNLDLGNLTFDLVDSDGIPVDIESLIISDFNLLKEITGTELYVTENDAVSHTFKLKKYIDGEAIDFIFYNGTSTDDSIVTAISIILITKTNVSAAWLTAFMSLGSDVYSKTLLSLTLTIKPEENGQVSVGYETRNFVLDDPVSGLTLASLEDMSLASFSLASLATSFTKKVKERNFNYIYFYFISNNEYPCTITALTVRFQYNNMIRGAR